MLKLKVKTLPHQPSGLQHFQIVCAFENSWEFPFICAKYYDWDCCCWMWKDVGPKVVYNSIKHKACKTIKNKQTIQSKQNSKVGLEIKTTKNKQQFYPKNFVLFSAHQGQSCVCFSCYQPHLLLRSFSHSLSFCLEKYLGEIVVFLLFVKRDHFLHTNYANELNVFVNYVKFFQHDQKLVRVNQIRSEADNSNRVTTRAGWDFPPNQPSLIVLLHNILYQWPWAKILPAVFRLDQVLRKGEENCI